jgi:hypothetical protein
MNRRIYRNVAYPAALVLGLAGCSVASGHETTPSQQSAAQAAQSQQHSGHGASGTATPSTGSGTASGSSSTAAPSSTAPAPAAVVPGTVTVTGTPVKNLVEEAAPAENSEYCKTSKLPRGEGLANKGGTCVSTAIGEIAAHPVRVASSPDRFVNRAGKSVRVRISVADNQGPLDLNAFTHDANNKAGVTLHEHPGQLDERGRPLLHCHIGVVKIVNGFPGETYDAAFSGVQGFRGKGIVAKIDGLPRGSFRADTYCSQPGHPALPTALANQVQAFDSFKFVVVGRR